MSTPIRLVQTDGSVETTDLETLVWRSDKTLLYFYPKDLTPGCTLEGQDFSRNLEAFGTLGIRVVGVSLDSAESHGEFIREACLRIPLVSDDGTLHAKFDVIGTKKLYGKTYEWVIRSTLLLDRTGSVLQAWRNVKATGHADRLLKILSAC